MKATINREALIAALAIVKPAANKATIPILGHVFINVFDKSAEFICTNLDLTLRARAECTGERGSFTVSAGLLHSLVNSFDGDTIKLEIVKDRLLIVCGKSKYRLGIFPGDDFPPPAKMTGAGEFKMPQSDLKTLLSLTSFCSGDDDSRFLLESVCLQIGSEVIAVSTDGRRLARFTTTVEGLGKKPVELILPDYLVKELIRLLSVEAEKTAEVAFLEGLIRFTFDDIVVTSKLIEGKYPGYTSVIPEIKGRKPAIIPRAEMLICLKRCAMIGEDVLLDLKKSTLNISTFADGKKIVGEGSEAVALVEPIKENISAKFQTKYLIEALSAIEDENIEFYGGGVEPGVITIQSRPWLNVIMPMRLQDSTAPSAPAIGPSHDGDEE